MTDALKPCRDCGKDVSGAALTCPHCGAMSPASSAPELRHAIQHTKARGYQGLGAALFFGGMALILLFGKDWITFGLLAMGAGIVLVVAARIDMNRATRQKAKPPPS